MRPAISCLPALALLSLAACATNGPQPEYGWMLIGYQKSLGTDTVVGSQAPQQYGTKLMDASVDRETGVDLYKGPPLKFRLVEVEGVKPGAQVTLMKSGQPVGTVPFAAGTTFELGGGYPATAVFNVPRSAWTGADPVVCYELLPGQGYHLTELPYIVKGRYAGRQNLDCTPPGDISRIMRDPQFTHIRMNAIIERDAGVPMPQPKS